MFNCTTGRAKDGRKKDCKAAAGRMWKRPGSMESRLQDWKKYGRTEEEL
jgi:hypothetical protein